MTEILLLILIDPTKTELIGYSLSAHVARIAAQEVKQDHPPINQIMGLNPADVLLILSICRYCLSRTHLEKMQQNHTEASATFQVFIN